MQERAIHILGGLSIGNSPDVIVLLSSPLNNRIWNNEMVVPCDRAAHLLILAIYLGLNPPEIVSIFNCRSRTILVNNPVSVQEDFLR